MRAVAAVVEGVLVGVLLGAAARLLMRVVALGMGDEPAFDPAASGVLVGLFGLSCAGAALAGALLLRGWQRWLTLVVSSGPILLLGLAFAIGELGELLSAGLSGLETGGLLGVAALILVLVAATPTTGTALGERLAGGAPGRPGNAPSAATA